MSSRLRRPDRYLSRPPEAEPSAATLVRRASAEAEPVHEHTSAGRGARRRVGDCGACRPGAAGTAEIRGRYDGGGDRRRRARQPGTAGHRPDARGLRAARRRRAAADWRSHARGCGDAGRGSTCARRHHHWVRASRRGPTPFAAQRHNPHVCGPGLRPSHARGPGARAQGRPRVSRHEPRGTTSRACSCRTSRWCRSRPTPTTG